MILLWGVVFAISTNRDAITWRAIATFLAPLVSRGPAWEKKGVDVMCALP
jgi:hypothetical protein